MVEWLGIMMVLIYKFNCMKIFKCLILQRLILNRNDITKCNTAIILWDFVWNFSMSIFFMISTRISRVFASFTVVGSLTISPLWTLLTVISTERSRCQKGRSISVFSQQYETSYLFYVTLSFLCNIICYLISVFAFSLVTLSRATTYWRRGTRTKKGNLQQEKMVNRTTYWRRYIATTQRYPTTSC